ncbi:hypothetical protein SAMN06298216_4413 [Spirosomataceae bacterium TFI 002]|nr:hypothetical protein SAMN06298216_4413 [Spirosomataceae bacterium TFI 002]
MSSPKLSYLYLPIIALVLSVIGIVLKLYYNEPVPITLYFFIPFMIFLLGVGIKKKVWRKP